MVRFIILFAFIQALKLVQCRTSLYIMRHAERLDKIHKDWIEKCFQTGVYVPVPGDDNFPETLPNRPDVPNSFVFDSPLTKHGYSHAKSTGNAFKTANIEFNWVISSPALRAVQTAAAVLDGMTSPTKIIVEPNLYEKHANKFTWMTDEQLKDAGYPVYVLSNNEIKYERQIEREELMEILPTETGSYEYYHRSHAVLTHIEEQVKSLGGGNVLIVAHGPSFDALSRQHIGKPMRSYADYRNIATEKVTPYCCVMKMVRLNEKHWKIENVNLNVEGEQENTFDVAMLLDESGVYVKGVKQK